MPNLSSAYGTYKIIGEWTNEMLSALNATAKVWESFYFPTLIMGEFTEEIREQPFNGDGRWTYTSNLQGMHEWTLCRFKEGEISGREQYEKLLVDMEAKGSYIEVEFNDEECGCPFLYESLFHMTSKDGRLTSKEIKYTNYDYTWTNYIDVTGDDNYFEALLFDVIKKLRIEDGDERAEHVEKWLLENTFPNTWKLDKEQMKSAKAYIAMAA
jgi:hypothetical protein